MKKLTQDIKDEMSRAYGHGLTSSTYRTSTQRITTLNGYTIDGRSEFYEDISDIKALNKRYLGKPIGEDKKLKFRPGKPRPKGSTPDKP